MNHNSLLAKSISTSESGGSSSGRDRIIFDISDLIQYWQDSFRPTGIQRVQIEVINSLLVSQSHSNISYRDNVYCVFFSMEHHDWKRLDTSRLLEQIQLSYQSNYDKSVWLSSLDELIDFPLPFAPEANDVLINLGSSWWIPDYLYKVNQLKQDWGLRYIPFIHDAIPLVTPQYCAKELVLEFLLWFRDAIRVADHVIVNSECSKSDVHRLATINKGSSPEITVCTLDAKFERLTSGQKSRVTKDLGIHRQKFVLCVGTLEVRKNHLLLFRVWSRLINSIAEKDVPYLVLVGKPGWKFELSKAYLSSDPDLEEKIIVATNLSDADLALLYEECQFAVYPSFYEGWGLPLTEAASYGKLTVCSNTSSIPEAASRGDILLDPTNEDDWFDTIKVLVLDAERLASAQMRSIQGSHFRTWSDIALTICSAVKSLPRSNESYHVATISDGIIYDFSSMTAKSNYNCSAMALRHGGGWHHLESWGAWSAPGLTELVFDVPDLERRFVYLALRGGRHDKVLKIWHDDSLIVNRQVAADQQLLFRIDLNDNVQLRHTLRFTVDEQCDFAKITDNADRRKVGIAFLKFSCMKADDLFSRQNFIESLQMQFA